MPHLADAMSDPLDLVFHEVARHRETLLLRDAALDLDRPGSSSVRRVPQVAPFLTVLAELGGSGDERDEVRLHVSSDHDPDPVHLEARYDDGVCRIVIDVGGRVSEHRSRRSGTSGPADALALCLTGTQVTALTRNGPGWTARARIDLHDLADGASSAAATVRRPRWLAGVEVGHTGSVRRVQVGPFGQLGLRDLRLVTEAGGGPYRDPADPGARWLTATSAGPGFFGTAHTSVWRLDPHSLALTHTADLFFANHGQVRGHHASHLLHDPGAGAGVGAAPGRWLVATSTWADFDKTRHPHVGVDLAQARIDLRRGQHVLPTDPLHLPAAPRSVGCWDPHLVRTPEGWLVGFVEARKFFEFSPALAAGSHLATLRRLGGAPERTATEGTTLLAPSTGGDGAGAASAWRILASDGREGPKTLRARYPVLGVGDDGALVERGTLDAPYPTNLPWPTLVPLDDGRWLMVTFDGTPTGGRVTGYGTHGDVVIMQGQ
ncbi:hypothetical protein [Nocardioides acrostichi]|uniref:Uncharacterized protein n=1 Tax=Nocardioides acrostichi TaxID=2784339 RepID=A0A930Y6Q9_9ACTN|nr:hypothetical protein [Nocardioides acrostichi]MBF4162635.1 hypothetical protein [Nocardioides acrostichi]